MIQKSRSLLLSEPTLEITTATCATQHKAAVKRCHSEPAYHPEDDTLQKIEGIIREIQQEALWDNFLSYVLQTYAVEFDPAYLINDIIVELAGDNPRLAIDAYVYALGLNVFQNLTLRENAKRAGCTPEGFSKRVDEIRRRHRIAPNGRSKKVA